MDRMFAPDELAPSAAEVSTRVTERARALGFTRVGFTRAEPLESGRRHLEAFLGRGYAGGMEYLSQEPRHDPAALLPGAKSVIVVALSYGDRSIVPLRRQGGLLGRWRDTPHPNSSLRSEIRSPHRGS